MPAEGLFKPIPNMEHHRCFGCGPANPSGLRLQFYSDGASVFSRVTVPDHLCGWSNLVHGGVISTILDEIMGRSVIYLLKSLGLTKSMTVDFLKPVFIAQALKVEGRILDAQKEREVRVEGILSNEKGEICARSTGTFAVFKPDAIRKLGIANEELLAWFEEVILKA